MTVKDGITPAGILQGFHSVFPHKLQNMNHKFQNFATLLWDHKLCFKRKYFCVYVEFVKDLIHFDIVPQSLVENTGEGSCRRQKADKPMKQSGRKFKTSPTKTRNIVQPPRVFKHLRQPIIISCTE